MKKIFGFDIGTTSIGYCVLYQDPINKNFFLPDEFAMGVRIFPDSVNPDNQEPKNKKRRETRMKRRQLRRRKQRRCSLNQLLSMLGMLPSFNKDKNSEWHNVMMVNPVALRVKGLTEELSPYEFGRALYHLSKKRHFKGRDIINNSRVSKEEKAAKSSREKLVQELNNSEKTLGTYLFNKDFISKKGNPATEKQRGHQATREAVIDEFNQLWDAQQKFNREFLNSDVRNSVFEAIFKQRPVFWRTSTLGKCNLIPDADLCARGTWLSHQRRMLENLNNLSVVSPDHRPLDSEERQIILNILSKQKTITWDKIKESFAPLYEKRGQKDAQKRIRFNYEASTINKEKAFTGNPLEVSLQKIFGEKWNDENFRIFFRDHIDLLRLADFRQVPSNKAQRIELISAKEKNENRRQVIDTVFSQYNLDEQTKLKLLELNFETGWEPYSTEALKIILEELENGTKMGELINSPLWKQWRDEKFPLRDQPTGEFKDLLPSPADKEEADIVKNIRNPTVVRVRNEVRKVVNNLIRVHGKPDLIRVEVTRDIGYGAAKRSDISNKNKERNKVRNDAKKYLIKNGITTPSRRDVEKWLLWEECKYICPYSGHNISFDDLFRKGRFEIEHILPRSRVLDDSLANKTLCLNEMNKEKGGNTPFEAFGTNEILWKEMCLRVEKSNLPQNKKRRFQMKTIPEGFSNRHLSDTSYAATEVIKSLRRLWPDVGPTGEHYVQAVSGRLTSHLRHLWGLNSILSDDSTKNRDNHKHHAIDALVVACTNPITTKLLSEYWKQKDCNINTRKPILNPPWENYRSDAELHVSNIIVSHKVQSKISGSLHEDTYHRYIGIDPDGNHQFTYRKDITSLKSKNIEPKIKKIRDPHVRDIVKKHFETYSGNKGFSIPIYINSNGPQIKKVKCVFNKTPETLIKLKNGYVPSGNNHHMAIYKTESGETTYKLVSLFEACDRKRKGEQIIKKNLDGGYKIVMALYLSDTINIESGKRKGMWRIKSLSLNSPDGLISLVRLEGGEVWGTTVNSLVNTNKAKKISVDPIGRISKCGF